MTNLPTFVHLTSQDNSIVFSTANRLPEVIYWGSRLSKDINPEHLILLRTRQEAKCAVVEEPPISLSPNQGQGFTGKSAIEVFNSSNAWSMAGDVIDVRQSTEQDVCFVSKDAIRNVELVHNISLCVDTNVLSLSTKITNLNNDTLHVNACAAPCLPLPADCTTLTNFEGRWAHEFHRQSQTIKLGSYVRENRRGKTSHDTFPGMLCHKATTNELQGEVYGFHLGHSGNHSAHVELMADGRSFAQMSELLSPGEIRLAQGESYQSPTLYASYSHQGFSQLSQHFHQFVRQHLLRDSVKQKPRPVHYNTWEGIYFDHNDKTLMALADEAADVGAERFVLDDGWFNGRRGDFAGLGDWFVDKEIYPKGLAPLIQHVNDLGMEFGIWFEPEMVNPDSDLYRNHPEWVLQTQGNKQINFRNQYVLDLTNTDVTDYLYQCISDILLEYPEIKYIKWDMNRDVNHAGNLHGQPAMHKQIKALYALINRLREAFTTVEIESCCSGGGRVDFGILEHTDRVWTSDSNDALDRLDIQRGCSFFFPAEVMGAHVGPTDCHITGRRVSMEMRCAVAMFGHMGFEMDPRALTLEEKTTLKQALEIYKEKRSLIHSARLQRLESVENEINFALINQDKSQALFSFNLINETHKTLPNKMKFSGLDKSKHYQIRRLWPTELNEYSTSIMSKIDGQVIQGELLVEHGMQMPLIDPQSSLIFELIEQQ